MSAAAKGSGQSGWDLLGEREKTTFVKKTWLLNWRSIERKELYEMDSFTGHTQETHDDDEKRKYFQINALLVEKQSL